MLLRLLILVLCIVAPSVHAGEARELTFRGIRFTVYSADPADVTLHWREPQTRQPYKRFSRLHAALVARGIQPALIMNAGIFEPGGVPSGLHVEAGRELRPLNLKDGEGNFYLKPNGVFGIGADGKAFVVESSRYARAGIRPRLALQSGPLLLQNGRIHPAFNADSPNRRHRNGVGVDRDGRVVFACTDWGQDRYVTLHEFAELFLSLNCREALFLDGDLAHMALAPTPKLDIANDYAAFLVVTDTDEDEAAAPGQD